MTPLTANSFRKYKGPLGNFREVLVENGEHIFKNALTVTDSDGYLQPATTDPTEKFAGLAIEEFNNTGADGAAAADGRTGCDVAREFCALFAKSGTITQAHVGEPVCAIDDDTVARSVATYTTALTGSNNDLVWTSKLPGVTDITIEYFNGGATQTLRVDVFAHHIRVWLGTDGSSVITTTGDLLKAAIAADVQANALVTVDDAASNDGSGLVTVLDTTPLALPGPIVGKIESIDGSSVWVENL